jgi:hypothetical protein
MISALRRSRLLLVTAVAALLGAMPMAALPLLHGGDHPACDPQAMHDSSAHHLSQGNGARGNHQQHCMVCHWSQWVRAIQEDTPAATPYVDGGPIASICAAQPRTTTAFRSFARPPPLT